MKNNPIRLIISRMFVSFIALCTTIGFAVYLAYIFVEWADNTIDPYGFIPLAEISTSGISLAYLLAFWKDFGLFMRDIKNYISNQKFNFDFYRECLELLLQLFFIFVLILSYKNIPKEECKDQSNIYWDLIYLANKSHTGDHLATFPIVFKNAELEMDSESYKVKNGFQILEVHKSQLDKFLNAIIPCAKPNNAVKLEIRGYSSSKPFKGVSKIKSDKYNVELANLRGESVLKYFENHLDSLSIGNFQLNLVKWNSNDEMKRPYFDDSFYMKSDAQELFNRSAFIILKDAGVCSVNKN